MSWLHIRTRLHVSTSTSILGPQIRLPAARQGSCEQPLDGVLQHNAEIYCRIILQETAQVEGSVGSSEIIQTSRDASAKWSFKCLYVWRSARFFVAQLLSASKAYQPMFHGHIGPLSAPTGCFFRDVSPHIALGLCQ